MVTFDPLATAVTGSVSMLADEIASAVRKSEKVIFFVSVALTSTMGKTSAGSGVAIELSSLIFRFAKLVYENERFVF